MTVVVEVGELLQRLK